MFDKRHDHVLRDISNLDCSGEFHLLNFGEISYEDSYGRKQKAIAMSRDGFMFLVMGYRGKKAAAIKEAYIRRFNEMEHFIRHMASTRSDFPMLTEQIMLLKENPKPYHFSNECDMLNRIVIDMTAKQFRLANNIPEGQSIRPHLTHEQIAMLEALRRLDFGLLAAVPDYHERKRILQAYADRRKVA